MTNHERPSSNSQHLRGTLRVKRLLATQLRLFRLEVVGQDHPALARAGALLIFGPFLLVGYAFALAAAVRYLAIRIGWGAGLLIAGSVHLVIGAWGLRRGGALGFVQSYDVVVPDCEPEVAATQPSIRPPARGNGWALGKNHSHSAV